MSFCPIGYADETEMACVLLAGGETRRESTGFGLREAANN